MSARVRMRQLYCLAGRLKIQPINEGEIIDVNSFMEKMVGYSCQELKGKKLWEAGFILDIEAVRSAFLELQKKEYCLVENIKMETKDE